MDKGRWGFLLGVLCASPWAACHRSQSAPAQRAAAGVRVQVIDDADARGLSGLAPFGEGFAAVAERSGKVFLVQGDDIQELAVEGIPDDTDLEGVALFDENTFVFSTESGKERDYEMLLVAKRDQAGLKVSASIPIKTSAEWNFKHNTGLEGICVTSSRIWVAAEVAFEHEGRRYAPVAALDIGGAKALNADGKLPTWYWIALSSTEGKLAALDCEESESGTKLWAIERHFSTARIIEADIAASLPAESHVTSKVVLDISKFQSKENENFEGLARNPQGHWVLVNDNEYVGISGPSKILTLP